MTAPVTRNVTEQETGVASGGAASSVASAPPASIAPASATGVTGDTMGGAASGVIAPPASIDSADPPCAWPPGASPSLWLGMTWNIGPVGTPEQPVAIGTRRTRSELAPAPVQSFVRKYMRPSSEERGLCSTPVRIDSRRQEGLTHYV